MAKMNRCPFDDGGLIGPITSMPHISNGQVEVVESIILVEHESTRIVPFGPGLAAPSAWLSPQEYLSCI